MKSVPFRPSTSIGMATTFRVLLVDSDTQVLNQLRQILLRLDCEPVLCTSPAEAIGRASAQSFELGIFAEHFEEMSGNELCDYFLELLPRAEVIMMAEGDKLSEAPASGRAHQRLDKSFVGNTSAVNLITHTLDRYSLRQRNEFLERQVAMSEKFEDLIGHSPKMRAVFELIESVAPTDVSVLIEGESGTGKELIARALHRRSLRADSEMVPVHCGAIPEALLESELFGHVKGAFTGANQIRVGHFESASGGTIFLDEIGEMSVTAQVKLLRVLQENEIMRVGESRARKVDVRVVAATNVDLRESVARGDFRNDLFYRLNVISLKLPALRERKSDIPILARHFLRKYSDRMGKKLTTFHPLVMEAFLAYAWPGNVREMENVIEAAAVLAKGETVELRNLSVEFRNHVVTASPGTIPPPAMPSASQIDLDLSFSDAKKQAVKDFEIEYLRGILRQSNGNISEAARKSGLDRSNFRRVMQKHKSRLADVLI